jgi:hypothetical protein
MNIPSPSDITASGPITAGPILPQTVQGSARSESQVLRRSGKFYLGMVLVAFAICIAGFGRGMIDPGSRQAPMNFSVALHGLIFTAWFVLFATQATLVSAGNVRLHRRLGIVGVLLALLMIGTGYTTAIAMARRGFDLSGHLNAAADPLGLLVFQLGDLLSFAILVGAAVWYRRRAEIHKRLMLLATVGSLMGAPLAHLIGQIPQLQGAPPVILIPLVMLYSSHAVYDRVTRGRIHPVSLWVPIGLFVWANLRAAVIGPSAAWHEFAAWLIR